MQALFVPNYDSTRLQARNYELIHFLAFAIARIEGRRGAEPPTSTKSAGRAQGLHGGARSRPIASLPAAFSTSGRGSVLPGETPRAPAQPWRRGAGVLDGLRRQPPFGQASGGVSVTHRQRPTLRRWRQPWPESIALGFDVGSEFPTIRSMRAGASACPSWTTLRWKPIAMPSRT